MKISLLDFLLSGVCIALLLTTTVGIVGYGVVPVSCAWLGDYHVIADVIVGLVAYGLLTALAMRILLVVRPLRPGTYALDSATCTWWKLITVIHRLGEHALMPFVPVFARPQLYVLFGARIGRDVAIGGVINDPFLVTIDSGVVLGHQSLVSANLVSDGKLVLGAVRIGSSALVGINAVVLPGCEMGARAVLAGGAILMPGSVIPVGESWRGNPARVWVKAPLQAAGVACDGRAA